MGFIVDGTFASLILAAGDCTVVCHENQTIYY